MTYTKAFRAAVIGGVFSTLAVFATAAQSADRTVTDMSGRKVPLPGEINRIAQQFPAHTVTVIMLGAGEKLVAIPQNVKIIPLMSKIYPRIADIPEAFPSGGPANVEDLLTLQPDVVTVFAGATVIEQLTTAGIPAVVMDFTSFKEFPRSISLAGEVFGGEAVKRATAFNEYFEAKFRMIEERTKSLTVEQRPSVAHVSSFDPLAIDGNETLMQEWIELGGGTAAAVGTSGVFQQITFEQLLQWDPDVIVVQQTASTAQGMQGGSAQSVLDEMVKTTGWSDLKAVRDDRVYINPRGMYPWERFGPEEAMQIQWIAKTLHPELFEDLDIRAEARSFYQTFFGYQLSDTELDEVLQVSE